MALLGIIMLGVYASLTLTLRYQRALADSVETFGQALLASQILTHALGTGAQATLVIEPGLGFAFASAAPPNGPFQLDSSGTLENQKFVVFYLENDRLYRGEMAFPPAAVPPETPPVATLKTDTAGKRVLVAEGVVGMEVTTLDTTDSLVNLKLTVQSKADQANATTLETGISFRV